MLGLLAGCLSSHGAISTSMCWRTGRMFACKSEVHTLLALIHVQNMSQYFPPAIAPLTCGHRNKPFKYEYTDIEWEYNDDHFDKWCKGETGFPIVDAAMRQLNNMGYMHNRCRMIVGSFLAKDLLIDWRMGERYFMEHLIDGYGSCASTRHDIANNKTPVTSLRITGAGASVQALA